MNAAELARMAGSELCDLESVRCQAAGLAGRTGQPVFISMAEHGIVGALPSRGAEHVPALPVRGYLVGGPIYRPTGSQVSLTALRSLAGELGLAGRVGFTGFVMEPADAMRALDVVVHASTQAEPFGLVIAEAMACARPVLTTTSTGAAEWVRPGETGWLVPPRSTADLAAALASAVEARPRLRQMGEMARAEVERRAGPHCDQAVAEWVLAW